MLTKKQLMEFIRPTTGERNACGEAWEWLSSYGDDTTDFSYIWLDCPNGHWMSWLVSESQGHEPTACWCCVRGAWAGLYAMDVASEEKPSKLAIAIRYCGIRHDVESAIIAKMNES